jgi:DNA-binding transcriptional regulator of glucitol operon
MDFEHPYFDGTYATVRHNCANSRGLRRPVGTEGEPLSGTQLAILIGIVVALWILQLLLSYRQAITVSKRIADLRRRGMVAVGLGRGRYRSRVYAVLAVDRSDRVVGVEVLRGWSTLSRPKPIAELAGLQYLDLCEAPPVAAFDASLKDALCQAVTVVRQAREAEAKGEGGVAIVQPS